MKSLTVKLFFCLTVMAVIFDLPFATGTNALVGKVSTYKDLLGDLSIRIDSFQKLLVGRDDDWLVRERLAGLYIERAGLTNNLQDFSAAEKVLEQAFAIAPKGSGPFITAARANYSIHRLAKAEQLINAMSKQVLMKGKSQIALISLHANIAFQQGRYAEALAGYRECENLSPGTCRTDLALYYAHTGGVSEAQALFLQALNETRSEDAKTRAWIKLQLGILMMEQGRYTEALKELGEADSIFPGWWLVREHIAETHTLRGDLAKAVPIYEEVVKETGLPQYMDALAECYKSLGRLSESKALSEKAEVLWEEQLKSFPESASGHALEHYLTDTANKQKLLQLAESNFHTRPGVEARIFLSLAYLETGRKEEASKQITSALATTFRSAQLYEVASRVSLALSRNEEAEKYRILCRQINPSSACQ